MTNGEKIKEIFTNIINGNIPVDDTGAFIWWNAEYKEPVVRDNGVKDELEPAAKNDLALIHTEGLDEGIRCAMCTNYMRSDRGCDGNCIVDKNMYKTVMDAIEKRIQPTTKNDCEHCSKTYGTLGCCDYVNNEPVYSCKEGHDEYARGIKKFGSTTKNDLGVDAVSRKEVINQIFYSTDNNGDVVLGSALRERIARLPSVTPQEPRKGHWIDINHHHYYNDGDIETTELRCSCCNEEVEWDIELLHKPYYCENCGADMREVKE